jgi:hypothetical protein
MMCSSEFVDSLYIDKHFKQNGLAKVEYRPRLILHCTHLAPTCRHMPVHQSHVGRTECDDSVGVEHEFGVNGNHDEESG